MPKKRYSPEQIIAKLREASASRLTTAGVVSTVVSAWIRPNDSSSLSARTPG
jgi:hypothetical protein